MTTLPFDVAIIGGGIVGLATAYQLSQRTSARLVVLEAEGAIAAHQTSHNSGVIHSGLYYKPGSLKAQNCIAGREMMYRFCQEHGIAHDRCGKIVVATQPAELPALDELERRGRANGLQGMKRLQAGELREYEPHVAGIAGLHIPETGIIAYKDVAQMYARLLQAAGGEIRTTWRVHGWRGGQPMTLLTSQGEVACKHLIACAGLQSDRVARLCGLRPGIIVVPFRGEYYELTPSRHHLVKNLIYPVPDARFPFLGVHFTRMIQGGVEAGPNAVLALSRAGYRWRDISLRDLWTCATFGGFWKMAWMYGGTGCGEMVRSLSKGAFLLALQKLIPELRSEDIHRAGSGVRAQALEPTGKLVDDYRFVEEERMIHVLNAPSPAATSSLSIGQTVAEMAVKRFALATQGASPATR